MLRLGSAVHAVVVYPLGETETAGLLFGRRFFRWAIHLAPSPGGANTYLRSEPGWIESPTARHALKLTAVLRLH
jgi:hypothetical protein